MQVGFTLCLPYVWRFISLLHERFQTPLSPRSRQRYAQEHGVWELLQSMVASLVTEQPAQPLAHLLALLRAPPVRARVLILGPPGSGKGTLARACAAALQVPQVHTSAQRFNIAGGPRVHGPRVRARPPTGSHQSHPFPSLSLPTNLPTHPRLACRK